jgi:hypothetical protein
MATASVMSRTKGTRPRASVHTRSGNDRLRSSRCSIALRPRPATTAVTAITTPTTLEATASGNDAQSTTGATAAIKAVAASSHHPPVRRHHIHIHIHSPHDIRPRSAKRLAPGSAAWRYAPLGILPLWAHLATTSTPERASTSRLGLTELSRVARPSHDYLVYGTGAFVNAAADLGPDGLDP